MPAWFRDYDVGSSCHPENPIPLRGRSKGVTIRRTGTQDVISSGAKNPLSATEHMNHGSGSSGKVGSRI
jgi:hypothetical protein